MEDKNFIKGFNNGYLLKTQEPALLDKLLQGLSGSSPYIEGLKEGVKQRENEIARERIKQSLERGYNGHEQDRSRGHER